MSTEDPPTQQNRSLRVVATVDLPESTDAEPTAYQREQDRKSYRLEVIAVVLEGFLLFFTISATLAAGYVALLTRDAVTEAKRSADAAIQSNEVALKQMAVAERPWVSNAPTIAKRLTVDEKGVELSLRHTMKNHGNSVALYARASTQIFPAGEGYPDPSIAVREFCEREGRGALEVGETLFPDESASYVETTDLPASAFAKGAAPVNQRVPLMVGVCVVYRDTFSEHVHRTRYMFIVGEPGDDGPTVLADGKNPEQPQILVGVPFGTFSD